MNYHELLKYYINQSGLSLAEIENEMRARGFSTNKAYISKLQNNKIPPAGDDINEALAKIIGTDPEELILQANIIKSPVLGNLFKMIMDSTANILKNNKELFYHIIKNDPYTDQSAIGIIDSLFESEEMMEHVLNLFPMKIQLEMVREAIDAFSKEKIGVIESDGNVLINTKLLPPMKFRTRTSEIAEDLTDEEIDYLKKQLQLYREVRNYLEKSFDKIKE